MKREEILSQEEIDALMNVFSKKALEDEATSETELTTESAFHPSGLPRDSRQEKDEIEHKDRFLLGIDWEKTKKQFETISELLSHSLTSSLSEILKRDVVLNNFIVEKPVAYEDFLASMNSPSCIGVLTSEMSRITALLELDLNLAYSVIDIALGGKGDNYLKVTRALTDLELRLMKKPMEQILLNLDKALNLKLRLEGVFTYPSQININSSHEVVVPIAFDIMDQESTTEKALRASTQSPDETTSSKSTYTIIFCIPRIALESQFSNQNNVSIDDKKKSRYYEAIRKNPLIDVPLRLQAYFPKSEITIGKLMEMKIDDTIVLDMHKDDDVIEVELLVEECSKFKGKLGAIGRYKAVEII